jgi:hypothetical protein
MVTAGQQQDGDRDAERRNDERDVRFHGEVRGGQLV